MTSFVHHVRADCPPPSPHPPHTTVQELDSTWTTMEFEHDKHDRTGLMLLRASEELIETLEDNQVRVTS